MRKGVICLCSIVVLCFGRALSGAGNPVTTRHAFDLELSGTLDIGAVYRNQTFHNVYYGPHHRSSQQRVSRADGLLAEGRRIAPSIASDTGSMAIIDPQLSLSLKATMQENVVAVVELATPFYVVGDEGGSSPFRTNSIFSSDLYSNARLEHRRYLEIEQAYVELRNLIVRDSGLNLRLGITDYALDFRGNGNPFLIDIQNAENPFLSPTGAQPYLIVDQNGNPKWDATADTDRRLAASPNGRNSQDAAGALLRYATEGGLITLDAYFFNIFESYEKNRDDLVIGATPTIYFDENYETGKISPTILLMLNDSTATLGTVGTGIQFFPVPEKILELYTEGYFQFGYYAKNRTVQAGGGAPAQHFNKIVQRGAYAFYAGMRLQAPEVKPAEAAGPESTTAMDYLAGLGVLRPYIDISYWEISGDDEAEDSHNEAFVSLENNNLSLIVESSYWGLDIDQNYRAVRVQVGCYPLENLELSAMFATFHLQNQNGTVDNRPGSRRYKIGDEFDVVLTYEYSTHVKFRLGTGFLVDARALGTLQTLNLTVAQVIVDF